MRALARFSVGVTVAVLLASAAGLTPASAADSHALIQGSGSSWAANAVNQWVADVAAAGLQVVYNPDGSAAGRQDFASRVSDFAITDVPYLGRDPVTGVSDTSQGRDYGDIPVAAGGTAFPFHLTVDGTQVRSLRLTGRTIAKIFTNQIRNWDSPEITAENNGVRLPSRRIIPVVQSEESGVSYELTTYLADRYPKIWKQYAGTDKPSEYYPRKGSQIAENGSEGLMNYLTSSQAEGAIGAVEYSYALAVNNPVAKVENQAGYFVLPTQYNVSIALRSATVDENSADSDYMRPNLRPVFASADRRAYPLSSYSSMLIPTSSTDSEMTTAKRQTIEDFAYYDICQGQRDIGPIGYAPLPLNLVEAGFTQIARLGAADPGVDQSARTVSTCDNPTFEDQDLATDVLGSIAPEPPSCDRRGQGPCAINTVALLKVSRSSVRAGRPVVFRGRLTDTAAAGAPPHALVRLQRKLPHHHWTTIRTRRTSATGTVVVRLTPTATARYRLVDVEAGSGHPRSATVWVTVD